MFKHIQTDNHGEIAFPDAFTVFNVKEIHADLMNLDLSEKEIQINLSATTEIDGAAIQLLISFQKTLQKNGKSLSIKTINDEIKDTIMLFNLSFMDSAERSE